MDITSKLYEEQVDEVAPIVASAARGALAGAAEGAVSGALGSLVGEEDESINEFKDMPEDNFADEWSEDNVDPLAGHENDHMPDPVQPLPNEVDDESELDVLPDEPDVPAAKFSHGSADVSDLIGEIDFHQTNGTSSSDKTYDIEKLMNANPEVIRRIHKLVVGE